MMKFFWNARYPTAEFDIFEEFERFLLLWKLEDFIFFFSFFFKECNRKWKMTSES